MASVQSLCTFLVITPCLLDSWLLSYIFRCSTDFYLNRIYLTYRPREQGNISNQYLQFRANKIESDTQFQLHFLKGRKASCHLFSICNEAHCICRVLADVSTSGNRGRPIRRAVRWLTGSGKKKLVCIGMELGRKFARQKPALGRWER